MNKWQWLEVIFLGACIVLVALWVVDAPAQSANSQCTKETESQILSVSGNTLTLLDSCGTQVNSFELVIAGAPATFSATINGVMPGGTVVILGSTAVTTASQYFNVKGGPFTKYTVTASWTGGASPSLTVNRIGAVAFNYTGTVTDARNFPVGGADMAPSFLAACNSLPAQGGVIDMQGVPVPVFWDSNPFASQTCAQVPSLKVLLPPGAICLSVPLITPGASGIVFQGNGVSLNANTGGSSFVANNPSGIDAGLCPGGSSHPTYPSTPNVAVGGLLATSYIGPNSLITIASASSSGNVITITTSGPVAYPGNWVVGGPPVLVSGSGDGHLDGLASITSVNNATGVATFTSFNTVGHTVANILTAGPNLTLALANATALVEDGSYSASSGLGNGYQLCINNSFGGSWNDLTLYGNSIPNLILYYSCTKQEQSLLNRVNLTHHSLFAEVRDASFAGPTNAAPAHSAENLVQLDTGSGSPANQSITQASSTFTAFTVVAGATAPYNFATAAWTTALSVTPVVGSTVLVLGTGTGADSGWWQVAPDLHLLAAYPGCNAPSTTFVCLLTPEVAAHAAVAVGNLTLMTSHRMFEGFELVGSGTTVPVKIVAGMWASWEGTGTAGRSSATDNKAFVGEWDGSIKNGTWTGRVHHEEEWWAGMMLGAGSNTIGSWGCLTCMTGGVSLASTQFSNGTTIQNVDYGGAHQAQGPGISGTPPPVVYLGKYAFGNSLANICNVFAKGLFLDVRNNNFAVSSAGSSANSELNCLGAYSQGTQFAPGCYVAGAGPACGSATSGVSQIALAGTTVTVNTTAVTAKSVIDVGVVTANQGGLTCNAVTNPTALLPYVSAVVAGVSFTITSVAPAGGTACYTWVMQN